MTTYIALEFYDEKTEKYQIIGTVIDLPAGGRSKSRIFSNSRLHKSAMLAFIEERRVLTRRRNLKIALNTDHQQTGIL